MREHCPQFPLLATVLTKSYSFLAELFAIVVWLYKLILLLHFFSMSSRKYNADEVLSLLRDISSDESDADGDSDIESEISTAIEAIQEQDASEEWSSDEEHLRGLNENVVCAKKIKHQRDQPYEESDQVIAKDGTTWKFFVDSQVVRGRLQQQNIVRACSGPTAFSSARVVTGSSLSSFRVLFDEVMLRHLQKCTIAEGQRVTGADWNVSLEELEKFLGLVIARGVVGGRTLPIKNMWDGTWGCSLFSKTMSRDRFLSIMRFLRFDFKTERRRRIGNDRFCLISDLWYAFISNCQRAYVPEPFMTVDEQLLPCKARCRFLQYMANKPDKFGIKFWLAADIRSKYLFNGFPYLGKDEERQGSLPTSVVLKLMEPLQNRGYNVCCDNFFTSLDVTRKLIQKKTSLVGTIRQRRREVPEQVKARQELHSTTVVTTSAASSTVTLTAYQCKKAKQVLLLSSMHPNVTVPTENNRKRKPDTVLFYNKNKVAVDVLDQMVRLYSTKAASRRWPIHIFYNILDMALINSWIVYCQVTNSSISRRVFIQKVSEELTGFTEQHSSSPSSAPIQAKVRSTCATPRGARIALLMHAVLAQKLSVENVPQRLVLLV